MSSAPPVGSRDSPRHHDLYLSSTGFGYEFNSLTNGEGDELAKAYKAILEPPTEVSNCRSRSIYLFVEMRINFGTCLNYAEYLVRYLGCDAAESPSSPLPCKPKFKKPSSFTTDLSFIAG